MNTPATPPPRMTISPKTRERWFLLALGVCSLALVRLMQPFLTVMLFAAVVAIVAWPLHARIVARLNGRLTWASLVTTLVLLVVVFGPLSALLAIMAQQLVAVATEGVAFVQDGRLEALLPRADLANIADRLPESLRPYVPKDVVGAITKPLQNAVLTALSALGSYVPQLLNTTAGAALGTVVFLVCVITFFMEGPQLVDVVRNVSPLADDLDDELFRVFATLCNNLVMGALGTAAAMGTVATLGYALAGLPQALVWGALTGMMSFVPVVGSAVVSFPLALFAATTISTQTGLFVLGWSVLLTAQVDTFVRPMFMRGRTELHPVAIILSLLGGVSWLGAPGALLGPVIVAVFWTLYGIYGRHYLGWPPPSDEPRSPTGPRAWWASLIGLWRRRALPAPPPADAPPP